MKIRSVVSCVLLLIVCVSAAQPARKSAAKPQTKQTQPEKITKIKETTKKAKNGRSEGQSQLRRRDLSFFNTQSLYPTISINHPLPGAIAPLSPFPLGRHFGPYSFPIAFNPFSPHSLNETIKKLEADLVTLQELQKQTEATLADLKSGKFNPPANLPQDKLHPLPDQKLNVKFIGHSDHGAFNPFNNANKFNATLSDFWKGLPAFTNPNVLDPVFGPEIAPKFEIHYIPENFKFEDFPSFSPFLGGHVPPTFLDPTFGIGGQIPHFPFSPTKPGTEHGSTPGPNANPNGSPNGGSSGGGSGNDGGNPGSGNDNGNSGSGSGNPNSNYDPTVNGPPPDFRTGGEGGSTPPGPERPATGGPKSENFGENNIGAPPSIDGPNPNTSHETHSGYEQTPGYGGKGPTSGQSTPYGGRGSRASAPLAPNTRSIVGNSHFGSSPLLARVGGYQAGSKSVH